MESPNHHSHKDTDYRGPSKRAKEPLEGEERNMSQDRGPSKRLKKPVEGEDVSMSLPRLPEGLTETILAMVPFPFTFKARVLSKQWLARLTLSSFQDDEENKSLAIGFQKYLAESFMTWKAFGPVFAGDEGFFAYEQESQAWLRIPTVSFVPQNCLTKDFRSYGLHIEGALLLFVNPPRLTSDNYLGPDNLYVTNVLNGSWKQLPARPPVPPVLVRDNIFKPCGPTTLVSHNEAYKVIEFYTDFYSANQSPDQSFALIYNSKLSAWKWKRVTVPVHGREGVHIHGVVYWLVGSFRTFVRNRDLLTFNVEKETFEVLDMSPLTDMQAALYGRDHLLVCNDTLFMVVIDFDNWSIYEQVIVLKIDPVSQTMVKVTEGGAATRNFGRFRLSEPPASRGDCIFFLGALGDKILAYDTAKDDWSSFAIPATVSTSYLRKGCTWTSSFFQPGLNPFLEL